MLNRKIVFVILFLGFVLIPFTFAQDNLTLLNSDNSDTVLSEDSSYLNVYFNASVASDGDGSKDNPYKYLNSGRVSSNSNLYLADGEYELSQSISISSYNSFIGQSKDNTIIKYTNTNRIFNNKGVLGLYNLTLTGGSIYNAKNLTVDNVIFKDSSSQLLGGSINSYNANLTISNSDFYNNSAGFGAAIYSQDSSISISNSDFYNNSADLGGAICDLDSIISMINVTAYDNSAIYQGGTIYKMYGMLNLTSSKFFNNSASEAEAIWADYMSFNMTNNEFTNNDVYSVVNSQETFVNNTFIESELIQQDFYNINFEGQNYTQIIYNPYNGTIPSRYDSRDYGLVTPVKNQGNGGNCWAFAAIAALESCILKATGIEYDFSEENMKNLMAYYSDYGRNVMTNNGGYTMMPIGYLASWLGPVNDSDNRYYADTLLSPTIDSVMHVQNIMYLPRSNYTDNDRIKQAILDYGAVVTLIYATGQKYQYYSGTASPDHLVAIIGWDDNFSKSKFSGTKPPGDGAWICKNSWGTGWGEKGYFYVSYYDTRCTWVGVTDASYTFILNDTVRYDKNYQYDIAGMTDVLLTNQENIWYQNIFNATSDDIIAAFSTYFAYDSNFTVEVYVNNELKIAQNGSSPAGYFTFNFDEFIPVYKNDLFKIVLKLTSSVEAQVPISEKVSSTRVHYRPDISFVSYDGINWIDLYNYTLDLSDRGHTYNSQVACIKAFTIFNLTTTTTLSEVCSYKKDVNLTATVLDEYGHLVNEGYVIFECDGIKYNESVNNGIATLSINNLRRESYNVTATYENNVHYLSSGDNITFEIPKTAVNLTFNIDDIYYDDYIKVNISLKDIDGNIINSTVLLTIGDKSYNVNSNSIYDVPDLFSVGKYNVSVFFNETNEYYFGEAYGNVTVNRYDANLSVTANNIDYGDYLTFEVSLSIGSTLIYENVTLNINNVDYSFMANSEFRIPVILNASNYNVNVFFNGNERYNPKNATINVLVSKTNPKIYSNIESVKYGENTTAVVNLTGINNALINENVVLTVDNKEYAFMANSNYTLPVILNASGYTANILFNGNDNYNPINESVQFVVYKNVLNIDLSVSNTTYGEKIIINTYLTDINGNPLNEKLKLEINNVNYTVNSNSEFVLPCVLNASYYNANLYFDESNNYNKCNSSTSFIVGKSSPKLTLDIDNITYGDYLVVKNTLDAKSNHDLKLEINNKNYTVMSNSTYMIPDLFNVDLYDVVLTFAGDNNYNPAVQKTKVSVDRFTPDLSFDIADIDYGEYISSIIILIGINNSELNEDVVLTINSKDYVFMANDNFIIPILLNASSYQVDVNFKGDNNYNEINKSVNVNVNKVNPKLVLNISDTVYNEDVVINNYLTGINGENIEATLSLVINNKEYYINSNEAYLLPDKLELGKYGANIIFNGNTNYNKVNNSSTFEIYLKELNMDVDISKNINKVNITIKLSQMLNESIEVKINNLVYYIETINGEATLSLNDLELGQYSLEALFNKTSYKPVLVKDEFDIDTINTLINVDDIEMYYHDGTRLTARLTDSNNNNLANKTMKIFINGIMYTRTTDENGVFSMNIDLNSGKYLTNIEFLGDDVYINSSKEILVNVKSTLDAYNLTKYYRNASQFYATIRDFEGNPVANTEVTMNINGVFYTRTTNSNGVVRLNINLNPGEYILTVYNPITDEESSCIITVLSRLVENYDLVKYYRNASKYSVKVLDGKGSPLAGVDVRFNINGVFYTRTSDSNGVASLAINLIPGTYIITAEYDSLKVFNTIEVLSTIKAEDLVMNYRDGSKFKALILDGQGNPYPNQSVTFNINGVFYTRTTDSDGYASLNINLMAGKYIITSMFNGLSVSNTITINNSYI